MEKLFAKYNQFVRDKTCVVIGTQKPWIEALAVMNGASEITTLDYILKTYEHPKMYWKLVNDFLDEILESKQFEQFDFSASYSSIEHSGLGRYGDPLSPFGDLEAVRQAHCILKRGGVFFLGLPWGRKSESYIEYNAHRMYGHKRMELLLRDWKVLEIVQSNVAHMVFVLQKL
jgi:hypothetical protein